MAGEKPNKWIGGARETFVWARNLHWVLSLFPADWRATIWATAGAGITFLISRFSKLSPIYAWFAVVAFVCVYAITWATVQRFGKRNQRLNSREESDYDLVVSVRNDVQTLLDEAGEEPLVKYGTDLPKFRAQMDEYFAHFNKIHHRFERVYAPKVQEIIHRLGERNDGDADLELAMRNKEKDYKTIKIVIDRLSVIASRLAQK